MFLLLVLLIGFSPIQGEESNFTSNIPLPIGPSSEGWKSLCLSTISTYSSRVLLAKHFLLNRGSTVTFIPQNLTSPGRDVLQDYLRFKFLNTFDRKQSIVQIFSDQPRHHKFVMNSNNIDLNPRIEKYIIVTDTFVRFKAIFTNIASRSDFTPKAIFVILYINLLDKSDRTSGSVVAEYVFKFVYDRSRAYRMVLIFAVDERHRDVFAPNIFDDKSCGKVAVKKVGNCTEGDQSFSEKDLTNIFWPQIGSKCSFKLCMRVADPYVNRHCNDGLEVDLMQTIKNEFKMTWNETCITADRGNIQPNGTWTGFLNYVVKNKCDYFFGGFYPDNEVHDHFSGTYSYFEDSYSWFIRVGSGSEFNKIFKIFDNNTTYMIIVVLIIFSIVWFLFQYITPFSRTRSELGLVVLNVVAILFWVSINKPVFTSFRILFTSLVVFSFVITDIFTSQLITVFTHPAKPYQISTMSEVLTNNIPFGGPVEQLDWFQSDDDRRIFAKYNTSVTFKATFENLESVIRDEKVILAGENLVLTYPKRNQLHRFPNRVFGSPLEMLSRKSFPYKHKFDSFLLRLVDSGITHKIIGDFVHNMTYLENIRRRPKINREALVVLTTKHLTIAFAALMLGLSISAFVFVIEIEYIRQKEFDEQIERSKIIEKIRRNRRNLKTINGNMYVQKYMKISNFE